MKLHKGDILYCEPEKGCGLKVVVIEACEEVDCDLACCGKEMTVVKQAGSEIWKQFAEGTAEAPKGEEVWKKYAEGKAEEEKK